MTSTETTRQYVTKHCTLSLIQPASKSSVQEQRNNFSQMDYSESYIVNNKSMTTRSVMHRKNCLHCPLLGGKDPFSRTIFDSLITRIISIELEMSQLQQIACLLQDLPFQCQPWRQRLCKASGKRRTGAESWRAGGRCGWCRR